MGIQASVGHDRNHKTKKKLPELEADIRALADPESQADPKFQSSFLYTRITAKAMRQALIDQKGWTDEELRFFRF